MSTQLAMMEHDPSVLRPSFLEKSSKLIQKLHKEAPLKEISMGGKALQLDGPSKSKIYKPVLTLDRLRSIHRGMFEGSQRRYGLQHTRLV